MNVKVLYILKVKQLANTPNLPFFLLLYHGGPCQYPVWPSVSGMEGLDDLSFGEIARFPFILKEKA